MAINSKLEKNLAVTSYDFDPDATTATTIGWVAMQDFKAILVQFFRTVGTSVVTLAINAATDSSGTGTTEVVAKTFTAGQPDAVGDYVFLECGKDDIMAALANATHVSAVVSVATGTDEGVVSYIRGECLRCEDGLSSDSIA